MSTSTDLPAPALELDRVTGRVLRRLIPLLLTMYVVAFLDRANVGFAQASLQADRGLSDASYAAGASIFFIGYALLEVPSNIVLHRVGARRWMTRIMISWGLVSACMVFVAGPRSFYLVRFLLGLAEAGFFPGVILYLTYWAPKRYRSRAMGLFYLGLPIALTIGGPLSGVLLDQDGALSLQGWQWMFGVEGLLAVVVGLVALRFLTDRPETATWLPEPDRQVLLAALAQEDGTRHGPSQISRALRSGKVLYFCLIYFLIQAAVYGLTFFLPTQVAALTGQAVGWKVGLLTAVPWGTSVIAAILATRLADRRPSLRVPLAIGLLVASAVGIAGSTLLASSPGWAIVALSLAACGFVAVQPVFWTFPTAFLSGAAAAAGIGLINAVGNLGGFAAPNVRTWAESAFNSTSAGLLVLSVAPVLAAGLVAGLRARRFTDD